MIRLTGALLTAFAATGCGNAVGERVALELTASGTGPDAFVQGAWQVQLEQAEVGFGPLYLCPASIASDELCERAIAELREAVTLDALEPTAQPLPPLVGTTGVVRSAVYDYGISWPLTMRSPTPIPGTPGGHSARFAGTATDGVRRLHFTADVNVLVNAPGRLAAGEVTQHEVEDATSRLHLSFNPARWWRNVDFDALASEAWGEEAEQEELPEDAHLHIEPGSTAYRSLIHEMTAGTRPRFEWSRSSE